MTIKQREELFAQEESISKKAWQVRNLVQMAEFAYLLRQAIDDQKLSTFEAKFQSMTGEMRHFHESHNNPFNTFEPPKLAAFIHDALGKYADACEKALLAL